MLKLGSVRIEAEETLAFYRSQDSLWLVQLRHAFKQDMAHEREAGFCAGRIALIDQVLKERDRAGVV